ncbi:hypothetical protein J5N97_028901 [Dioscorea zingiberensis]|uniref:Uncharacterized protein n=1 Tax=Dioscorea zingiberensis TaxID=325984 RepID=A0A9D5C037_9LILI|nr:hypothetical protein J5N97_028901 [Dioscorea zingiberensis]
MLMVVGGAWAAPEKKGKKKGALDPASTHYVVLDPDEKTGQERFFCLARGKCRYNTIQCPAECPQRKPRRARLNKGCFADCSSRCETTCKYRKPNCNGYGSVCYDPRFVGGDGVMFYFHGIKGADFALVSDANLQINAHLIGTRPQGRARDFTWVQALAVLFDSNTTLLIAANRVSLWDDRVDALSLRWNGRDIPIPTDAEWTDYDGEREVVVERTEEVNSVKVVVAGLVEMDVRVTPIGEEENRTHGYRLAAGDAFAHLEMQFRFRGLTEEVDGILGQTYRPDYVSPVKKGVAMPMMGGEERFRLPSLFSTRCTACRFRYGGRLRGAGESAAAEGLDWGM